MSKLNSIIAIAGDTQTSAVTYDGSTWVQKTLPSPQVWKFIGGDIGKFIYYTKDTIKPLTSIAYSIVDNVHWKPGTLPTEQVSSIVAIADGDNKLYSSIDGLTFTLTGT